jgi:3-hydroxybutyryl-CoA dehydrogenase
MDKAGPATLRNNSEARGKGMEIKRVCVLGAGIMGAGIAQVTAEAGFAVTVRDLEDRLVKTGLSSIRKIL